MSDESPAMPPWARAMADLHVHSSPSLLPRHGDDLSTVDAMRAQGFTTMVLKAHEGSTVERAAMAGEGVYGGVVLNSCVGGANPDAVRVAAELGGRIVWLPTLSSPTHRAAVAAPELTVHRNIELRHVEVIDDGRLRTEWFDVLDAVAAHDLVLASGHLSASQTLVVFTEARRRGVQRLLVNHPKLAFLHWRDDAADAFRALGAHLELGIVPDLLCSEEASSLTLTAHYPLSLLVFGGDMGHTDFPAPAAAVGPWLRRLEQRVGADAAATLMTTTTTNLLLP
ncbi:DUF6282 family protein [Streptomyces albipurpureus]|uniref:DUF6282 family protein n=1 Tax=Streptomyces albipurpureus TaxID=2897419 RepID=A0ABT0UMZ4_9ACTN|nr:DUF6282 family protein [Streptomyces sp. CWNU-1]MCM2389701.1 DUF6282 family protein [Streptomyces sp. CWNU-1]